MEDLLAHKTTGYICIQHMLYSSQELEKDTVLSENVLTGKNKIQLNNLTVYR